MMPSESNLATSSVMSENIMGSQSHDSKNKKNHEDFETENNITPTTDRSGAGVTCTGMDETMCSTNNECAQNDLIRIETTDMASQKDEMQRTYCAEKSILFEDTVNGNSQLRLNHSHQSQIEPEGTLTHTGKNASRRFDDNILRKVLSEEEKDNEMNTEDSKQLIKDKYNDAEARLLTEPPGSPAIISFSEDQNLLESIDEQGSQVINNYNIDLTERVKDEKEIERNVSIKKASETPTILIEKRVGQEGENKDQSFANNGDLSIIETDSTNYPHLRRRSSKEQETGIPFHHPERGIPIFPPLVVPISEMSHTAVHGNNHSDNYNFHRSSLQSIPNQVTTMLPGGKRKIYLRLSEDVRSLMRPEKSSFLSFRRRKGGIGSPMHSVSEIETDSKENHWEDRGSLTVSWYEGTSSIELVEHVRNSVIRKLGIKGTKHVLDFRVYDESTDPPEGKLY